MRFFNTTKILKGFENQGEIPSNKQILKTTLAVAWPAVLESFLVSLTGFVDTIMVSVLGATAIAAIGLSTQPKFIAWSIFIAMSTAVSSVVARRRGEQDRESANKVLRTALITGLILTVVIAIAFICIADFVINLAGSEPETHELAVDYFKIMMFGLVFTSITLIINAAQRGAGNTKISMRTNVTANLVNMLFNFLLIEGRFGFPALGVNGAALATVIGTMVGCAMSIISLFNSNGFLYIKAVKGLLATKRDIMSTLNVGSSAFVEQIFMRTGFLLFTMTVAKLGTIPLAAHQIGMNFTSISFSFADGLAVASVALVGRSLGEKRSDLARLYTSMCQRLGLVCAVVISSIFFLFGGKMFTLFSSDPEILEYGGMIMTILCFVLFVQIQQVTIIGSLRGAGDARYTAFISLISVAFIRPFSTWLLCFPLGLGLMGAWLGFGCDQTLRFILSWLRFRKGEWLKIKL